MTVINLFCKPYYHWTNTNSFFLYEAIKFFKRCLKDNNTISNDKYCTYWLVIKLYFSDYLFGTDNTCLFLRNAIDNISSVDDAIAAYKLLKTNNVDPL